MAQDDYHYEIQLTNKQLVFYFLAGATGLILSFLAGVMVGRGVGPAGGEVQAARAVAEDRIVPDEGPKTTPAPPPASDLTYAQRLEGDKVEEALDKPKPAADGGSSKPAASAAKSAPAGGSGKPPREKTPAATAPPPSTAAASTEAPDAAASAPPAKATPAPSKPTPAPKNGHAPAKTAASPKAPAPAPGAGTFTIQVGAFKDKASAESVMTRLKDKGFPAYVVAPEGGDGGLFNVRVGGYAARADAERIQSKLRDEEKFKPFIVKQ